MVCEGNSIWSLCPLGSSGFVRRNGFYKDPGLGMEPHRLISKDELLLRAPWKVQPLFVVGRMALNGGYGIPITTAPVDLNQRCNFQNTPGFNS